MMGLRVPLTQAAPSSLHWGRCRYVTKDDCQSRRRRWPKPAEKQYPTATLLLTCQDRWTLCWMASSLAVESADEITLCYDESVKLMYDGDGVKNERGLSIMKPYLLPEPFPATCADTPADCFCSDVSHQHLTLNPTPESSEMLDCSYVASFAELPATLLSISLVRLSESVEDKKESSTPSPLEQACLKRQLVGCHLIYMENEMTTQISIPFQGQSVCFRVASILPTPKQSRSLVSFQCTCEKLMCLDCALSMSLFEINNRNQSCTS